MRKIYIVPNFVTTANMFCGFFSVITSIQGDFVKAAWLIVAASIFDMLDGRIARLAKATSEFGVQYDSLSDLISFGLAPAILLHQWALAPFGRLGWLAAFLFLACGALRLARFNVTTHSAPKGFFQGLPIPMAAGMVATFIIFHNETGWPLADSGDRALEALTLGMTFGLASLMVSTIRFPSFKELNWRSRASFGYLMVGVLAMILLAVRPEVTLFLILSGYVGISLGWNAFRMVRGPSAKERLKAAHAQAQAEHSGHGHGD
jgi:CDP-diacylglycerol--serine O-phosphatidyltransferase